MACDNVKCVIMGAAGVGKSAITLQLMQNRFIESYDPTIEDSYQKYVNVDGKPCRLDILDTAGQEEYKAMRAQYMRQGQGYLLVYSITDRASFENTKVFYDELVRAKVNKAEIVLIVVGNKSDLKDDRQIGEEEGKKLAADYGAIFYETSAKFNANIKTVFDEVIRRVRKMGVEPCPCKGTCKCQDRCVACGKARNRHKGEEHPFKEKKSGWCTIL